MDKLMIEEYKSLRQELEINRKFVFERPLLIVGAIFALNAALKEPMAGILWFLPIAVLVVLTFNLWFTFNRLWSCARIIAYILLVHEKRQLPWIGWENALQEFRRAAYRLDKQRKHRRELNTQPGTYYGMGYYVPIFYFHLTIGIVLTLMVVSPSDLANVLDVRSAAGGQAIPFLANLISLAIFILASIILFRPSKLRGGSAGNQEVWENTLRPHRALALFVPLSAVRADPALLPGQRGARKIVVTEADLSREEEIASDVWTPPTLDVKAQVAVMPSAEVAYFSHRAAQDRHYHKLATEIYMVVEGTMTIEVSGKSYNLSAEDMILVWPGSTHQVIRSESEYLCRVVAINSQGVSDKFVE